MYSLKEFFTYDKALIRKATTDDTIPLAPLINEAYSYQDSTKGEPRTNPVRLAKRITETEFYVVELNDQIVGCVYIEPRGESLHFGLLTVSKKLRGQKLAPAILSAIEKLAISVGFHSIELDYMSLAPWLKKYYQSHGYKETGERVAWGWIDLIRMQKILNSQKETSR